MSPTNRPKLSLEIDCQIEQAQNQVHVHYWPRFEQLQELTSEARQQYRILGKHRGPPMPKQPNALRLLLQQYAIALFDKESEHYPETPEWQHWLGCLVGRIHSMVLGKIAEIEEAGQVRYSTLKYHLSSEQMVKAISDGLQEHIRNHINRRLAQRLAELQQQLKSSANQSSVSTPSQPDKRASASRARREFVEPILGEKGWSILQWALEAEVAYNTVADYLAGKKNPYPSTRVKLAKALGISANLLP